VETEAAAAALSGLEMDDSFVDHHFFLSKSELIQFSHKLCS